MAFDSKYTGKIKIENGNINLYLPHDYYETIYVGNAVDAHWEGRDLIVRLSNGSVRRYENKTCWMDY